ncbi:hypothetical protein HSBAA_03470 [Vreelandella sulfidaeris]|uniref:hydroxyethylthiazole kinase n=1 Tax=Vreelandella sulfidaeris TaxID=115553 RepID=A0A455U3I4_9GAMM|nr:hypothetical protein HSBAA_03470 [Halomonas sulfidaeris]
MVPLTTLPRREDTMTLPPLGDYLATLRTATPLVHCMTNYVAMNSTANLLLATGASPAMLHAPEEVAEFTAIASGLSINIGTISSHWADAMLTATATADQHAIPLGVRSRCRWRYPLSSNALREAACL